ncbi:MAG: gamma-glutamylcyclotransferase [Leptonema sp. (in: bacteria)]
MENVFVYGTLLSFFQHSIFLKMQKEGEFLGKGVVRGKLYDVGSYPAGIPHKHSLIFGEIYKIPEILFFELDDYEDFNINYPRESLFKRKLTKTYIFDSFQSLTEKDSIDNLKENIKPSIPCWIYWYNQKIFGLKQIESGNYLNYITIKGKNHYEPRSRKRNPRLI